MPSPTPELVIFDCDGVLVDSEPISNAVLARQLSRHGLTLSTQEAMREFKGLLMRDLLSKAQRLGASLPETFVADFEAEREVAFRAGLRAVPGARALVQAVRSAGSAVCVASQGKRSKTELTLTLCGLRDLFADGELFSAHDVPRGKPYPDLFLHAARTLGVGPSACAVIEDTSLGVRAALSAGMDVLWFAAQADGDVLPGAQVPRIMDLSQAPARLGLAGHARS